MSISQYILFNFIVRLTLPLFLYNDWILSANYYWWFCEIFFREYIISFTCKIHAMIMMITFAFYKFECQSSILINLWHYLMHGFCHSILLRTLHHYFYFNIYLLTFRRYLLCYTTSIMALNSKPLLKQLYLALSIPHDCLVYDAFKHILIRDLKSHVATINKQVEVLFDG